MKHSLWRDSETQKRYQKYVSKKPADAPCEFCEFTPNHDQVLKDEGTFWVTQNIFPYTVWDSYFVDEHLMLVPKRHVDSIGKFTEAELKVFGKVLGRYEDNGYSVYGRSATNGSKSVAHQHTHLIKVSSRRIKVLVFLDRLGFTFFR